MAGLLEPEFAPAFEAWKAKPSPLTNAGLLTAVKPVIDSGMTSFAGQTPSPVLRSRAKSLVLGALPSYDPNRGKLRSHLLNHLQRLQRYSAQSQNIIRIPEAIALNYQYLNQAEAELRDRNGRDPSDAELADHTGLSFKRIAHIRKANMPIAEGQTQTIDAEGDMYDPGVNGPDVKQQVWEAFVYHDLGSTDKFIMDSLLGRNGRKKLTSGQIANALNITAGAVSQRTAKIQQLLERNRFTETL